MCCVDQEEKRGGKRVMQNKQKQLLDEEVLDQKQKLYVCKYI